MMFQNILPWMFCYIVFAFCHGQDPDYDVIILGSGMAGIRAAARLEEHGITNIKILDKSYLIGGLYRADKIGPYTVEVGPGRIWHDDPDIKALADQYIDMVRYPDDSLLILDDNGNDVSLAVGAELQGVYGGAPSTGVHYMAERLRNNDYPDISLMHAYSMQGYTANTPIGQMVNFLNYGSKHGDVESLKYRGVSRSGINYAGTQDGLGIAKMIQDYANDNIDDFASKLQLNATYDRIEYNNDMVTVHNVDEHITAKYLIVSHAMGRLRQPFTLDQFDPPLPDWKLQSIHGYALSQYVKIHFRFAEDITWFVPNDIWRIFHVSERADRFNFWQNFNEILPDSKIIQATCVFDDAERLRAMTDDEVLADAMSVLRDMFGDSVPDPVEMLMPRGEGDPLRFGSFAYWPAGYTVAQHEALKAAVKSIHFAGDYYMGNTAAYIQAQFSAGGLVADNLHECITASSPNPDKCGRFVPSYMARGCTYEQATNFDPNAKEEDGSCRFAENMRRSSEEESVEDSVGRVYASVLVVLMVVFVRLIM